MRTLFFVSFLLVLCSFGGTKLVKTKITKQVTVSLPSDFMPMTDDDLANKYFTYRKPKVMYTNPDRVVDFGFNETITHWKKADMPMLRDIYKGTIRSMYTKVTFAQDTIVTINKRDFLVFEFVSELVDDDPNSLKKGSVLRQYGYMQYTVENGKILLFNFTCPYQLKNKWQETAKQIMSTIKISET